MTTQIKENRYSSQRHSSQQKRQHPIHEIQEYSFQNDILNVEKLKLQEQLDFYQQRVNELQIEIVQQVSRREQDIINLKLQVQQMEAVNNELLQRLQHQKKSEEYLSNANHHVTALQRKLDQLNLENNSLQNKINNLTSQNLQLSSKWQKCSNQLKQTTTQKGKIKEYEDQIQRRNDELATIKEKYVSSTLELTIMKQAEQEYKNSVQQKIKMLVDQLKDTEGQRNMLQNLLQEPRPTKEDEDYSCPQCQELLDENEQIRQQLETMEIMNMNHQQGTQMKRELNLLQQRCALLQDQNQQLSRQLEELYQSTQNEEHMITSMKSTLNAPESTITTVPEFQNCMRSIELFIDDSGTQTKLKHTLEELQFKIEKLLNNSSIHQMYDRLLVKYYSLLKQTQNSRMRSTEQKRPSEATPKKYEEEARFLNQSLDSIGTDYKTGKKPYQQKF